MQTFDYLRLADVAETIAHLGPTQQRQPLAGGTDLLTLMKADLATPSELIDLKRLPDLPRGISSTQEQTEIGALTTLTEVEYDPHIATHYPALTAAVAQAATPQLRNRATIGGNLLQRPRCWYFRNAQFHCWLKGGDQCHARDGQNQFHALFGGGPCYATHPSDLATALLALDAQVRIQTATGEQTRSLADFYALPTDERRCEHQLDAQSLITAIILPAATNQRSLYLKAMDRKVWAFALVGVAAVVQLENARVTQARLVLGGVAPIPWRLTEAEQSLLGHELSSERIELAAAIALATAEPLAHNGYKIPLAYSLIRRALTTLAES